MTTPFNPTVHHSLHLITGIASCFTPLLHLPPIAMVSSLTNQWFLCSSASGVEEDPLSVAQRNTNVSAAAAAFLSPDASISSSRHLTQTGWQCRGQRPPSWLGRSSRRSPPQRCKDPTPKEENKRGQKKESQEHNSKLQGNRSNPVNLPKKSPLKIMLSTCVLPFQIPGGDLFLLLAGGGDEEDEECEDRTSSEQHRFAADAAVLAALVRTLPITSCCISL